MKIQFIILCLFITVSLSYSQGLVINEFLADNYSVLYDQDGEYDDWIELYNNSAGAVALSGYFLSDNNLNLTLWTFPDTVIEAGDFLLVWADGDENQDGLHANFRLNASGEALYFSSPDTVIIDEVTFGNTSTDVSIGRYPNGNGEFREMIPTPGGMNRPERPDSVNDPSNLIFGDNKLCDYYLHFYYDNWEDSLIYYFEVLDEDYIPAQLIFNDTLVLDSIGVRYKGNSSYELSGNTPKKPLKFKFDEFKEEQRFFGLSRLNFSNCLKDPSFMREKISYDIARRYLPAPRTAYANIYIDGVLFGFYVQVEQVDKRFLARNFEDDEFNLYKACDNGASLEYKGSEQANYESIYELKTNEDLNDFTALIEMIERLNNTPSEDFVTVMQNHLNLDNCIRLLAFNMVLSNFDSYTGSGRNFYLYDDSASGQFNLIPWDLNESFGVYKYNWDVISQDALQTSNINQRPLFRRIIEHDSLKSVYLNYIGEMMAGPASYDSVSAIVDSTLLFIDEYVRADDNKLYSYQNFLNNIENDVVLELGFIIPGIKSFSRLRNENLCFQLYSVPVHPGDTDNNGLVDELDILPIGLYFLQEGNPRPNSSFAWNAQAALEWDFPAATYADANGDGTVDEKDVIGIGVNWGNVHSDTSVTFALNSIDSTILRECRDNFILIYNSLTGNSEPVTAMRSLLESLLNIDPAVPAEFTLRQNYPNPFNPQTTISFDLPQSQVVSLIVFNIMGQMVSVPISGQRLSAGVHFIDFDASDLSSGVYFYRINDKSK